MPTHSTRSVGLQQAAIGGLSFSAIVVSCFQAIALWKVGSDYPLPASMAYSPLVFGAYGGALGLLFTWKVPHLREGRVAATLLGVFSLSLALEIVPSLSPSLLHEVAFSLSSVGLVVGLRFVMLFPRTLTPEDLGGSRSEEAHGKSPSRGRRILHRVQRSLISQPSILWVLALLVASLFFLRTHFIAAPYHLLFTTTASPFDWVGAFFILPILSVLTGLGFSFLQAGYRISTSEERRRVLWLLLGFLISSFFLILLALSFYLVLLTGLDAFHVLLIALSRSFVVLVSFPLFTGFSLAILYSGAFDVRPILTRTSVYGSLAVLFLFLLGGFGNLAEGWVEGGLGFPAGVGTVVTGGTLAVVLIPLKRRMDRFMNRILPATVLADAPTQSVAILFSDIVGYTRLTGEDQKTALTMMTVFHKTVDRNAREHRGRVVKTNADEVMLEFKDPTNAVRAASELRDEFHEAARKLDLPTPDICTGIHVGEVTRSSEGDLFGDAVNIASRVHGVAEPGQVVLSAAVKERLEEGEFELESLGAKELKNVSEAVECFGLRRGEA
ncbi:adenylate/guanylate cyclase domain-containing protein [Gemmatimonadota bacterium]